MSRFADRSEARGYGRIVGRVGALALFLGIGAAVGPAVASADTAGSANAHTSSTSHSAAPAPRTAKSSLNKRIPAPLRKPAGTMSPRKVRPADVQSRFPAPADAMSAAARWLRRSVGAAFFNASPTIEYDPAQNSTSQYGVVTGNLNGVDREGDRISYVLTSAPGHGSVIVKTDGSFSYVPNADFAASGGTDTFTVRIGDQSGNPLHMNLSGLTNADPTDGLTKISVTVAPDSTAPPEQLQMEALAAQIANAPQLQWTKNVLRPWWFAMGALKYLPAGGLNAGNVGRLNQAVDEFLFGVAMRVVNTDPDRPRILTYEIPPHTWGPLAIPGGRWAYDNPDSVYRTIPVNAASSYVIHGRFIGDPPADLNFSVYTDPNVTNSVANIGLHDLVVNPDGTFTITVSSSAGDGAPNHLRLTPDAQQVFIRDTLGEWTNSPVELSVQRIDGPPVQAPRTYGELVDDAVSLALTSGVALYGLMLLPFVQPVNFLGKPIHTFGTLSTQRQSSTVFRLEDDQAMVVTVTLGDAGYFTTPITDAWTITPDYRSHQSSLNSSQAIQNPDGSYTLVISKTDPGVANWVDTAGLSQGSLFVRWQLPGTNPDAAAPTVTSRVVRLADLPAVLPSSTVYVTPEQRAQQLAERQQAYDSRFDRFLTV